MGFPEAVICKIRSAQPQAWNCRRLPGLSSQMCLAQSSSHHGYQLDTRPRLQHSWPQQVDPGMLGAAKLGMALWSHATNVALECSEWTYRFSGAPRAPCDLRLPPGLLSSTGRISLLIACLLPSFLGVAARAIPPSFSHHVDQLPAQPLLQSEHVHTWDSQQNIQTWSKMVRKPRIWGC